MVVLTAMLWIVVSGLAWAGQSVSLGWKPSPDTNAVGYAVYSGTSSGVYSSRVDVGASTNCTVPNLAAGVCYYFVVMAYDASVVESPPSNEVNFTVPVNTAPVLPAQGNRTVNELAQLVVANTATDTDLPANLLSYQLLNPPAGAVIDPSGVITWTPTEAQGPGIYTLTTVVTDNGTPNLTATNSFVVTVNEVNSAPVLPIQGNRTVNELAQLVVANTASDSDIPASVLSYQLINGPSGAAINSSGVITWTPTEAQGPGTYTLTTVVTDNGTPNLSATNSFVVTVNEVNSAPVLPVQGNRTVNELAQLVVTNAATDADLPANVLNYQLFNPPAGAAIDTNGVITWTPTEAQGPGTYTLTTVVTDNGTPNLSATNSFVVTVNEVNSAPVLPVQGNRTVNELAQLVVANTATDTDVPANVLSYQLLSPPTGAAIDSSGLIIWTPTEAQAPGTYTLTTVVTDNGTPNLSATNSFVVTVNEVNSAPVLPVQDNRTVNELAQLVVTNTATDTDVPANVLSYQLITGPAGSVIDNNGVISWIPSEGQGSGTYTLTTVVTDNGTPNLSATNSFVVTVNEVNSAPVLPTQGNRTVNELAQLVVANTASDSDIPANVLSYQLITGPAGSVIDNNGVISWIPSEGQGSGTYTLTTVVTDNGTPNLSATNSFVVTVNEVNGAPALPVQGNRTVNELARLGVANTATDTDVPANVLNYQLFNPPAGAAIDTSGLITWTPTEAQGPGTYTLTTVVTDNGTPNLSATNSFVVTVNEVNSAPVLPVQGNRTVNELAQLVVANTATDTDFPANVLSYQLFNPPAGAVIDASGVITWTPTEAQGPGTYTLTTVVTDNGTPNLSATNSFVVTVSEVNTAPVLPVQGNRTVNELAQLVVANTATDTDVPANVLSYQLLSPPTGAEIDTNGVITWTPSEAQGPGTYTLTTVVTDNGTPNLSATNSFVVTVNEVNTAPVLPVQGNRTVNELALLMVTNTASDSDIPANVLSYQLITGPAGSVIDNNGVISWIPSEGQGPGTYTLTTVVTDDGTPNLSATNSFVVTVNEVNTAPVLPVQGNRTINELALLMVTNTASDSDIPANVLSYQLITGPAGSVIDNTGVISWIPSEGQGSGTYTLTTVVTDDGTPNLSATNSFVVTVNEVNSAPVLPVQGNRTVNELAQLVVTNAATDTDVPANVLNYQLFNPPAGAAIDTSGLITWTPTEAQGPGTYTLTTVVTDNGTPNLSATNSFVVTVNEVNSAPVLPVQANLTVNELAQLVVTNAATDSDVPANVLSYQLITCPAGSVIDNTGVISWIPSEGQGPGTYTLTTVVTDNGTPNLSATNSFVVTVNEVNTAPVLAPIGDQTVRKTTDLTFTANATDADLPAQMLTYSLDAGAPSGASIDSATGIFSWTPAAAQGPSTNYITIRVVDNGTPPLSDFTTVRIVVTQPSAPPVLTISAPNVTNVYGYPLETWVPTYSGFVEADSPASLASLPVLTTTASNTSPVGTYAILASGAQSSKYSIQYSDGTLTVVPATATVAVSSSQNPCLPGQAVTFAVVLSVATPGQGTPMGNVQFRLDGAIVGDPIPLNEGMAILTTSNLTHGSHQVVAEYAGDGNFLGATNSLSSAQVINTPPVPSSDTIQSEGTNSVVIATSDLLKNDSDADGDPISFLGASASSAKGGSITLSEGWLTYSPPAGPVDTDSFTYAVSDGFGPPVTATVFINIVTNSGPPPKLALASLADGSFVIQGNGVPGRTYRIEYVDDTSILSQSNWQTLGTAVADGSGVFSFVDTGVSRQRFYRAVYP